MAQIAHRLATVRTTKALQALDLPIGAARPAMHHYGQNLHHQLGAFERCPFGRNLVTELEGILDYGGKRTHPQADFYHARAPING